MDYKQAIIYIKERRRKELLNAGAIFDNLLKEYPEFYKIETILRQLELDGVKTGKTDVKKIAEFKEKKALFLKELGITQNILLPLPKCKKCADTGLNQQGLFCSCVKNLSINSNNSNIKIKLHSFSDINLNLYPDECKARNEKLISNIEKISNIFPNNKRRNILILGPPGTGKTMLAGCVAQTMLTRGFSVTSLSAFDFTNRCLSYHTTFDDNKQSYLSPVLDSSLLIIDDLGTEPILKNVTIEYLLVALNERMSDEKLTLITTNLSKEALLDRYGERIYSRLFDKVLSYADVLYGDDIRGKNR